MLAVEHPTVRAPKALYVLFPATTRVVPYLEPYNINSGGSPTTSNAADLVFSLSL